MLSNESQNKYIMRQKSHYMQNQTENAKEHFVQQDAKIM